MNFSTKPEWQNIEVQAMNRLPAHSPWHSTHTYSLDGVWRFALCEHPSLLPVGFFLPDFNDDRWVDIQVPGNWETQGHSEPIFTQGTYPFTDEPGAHRITPSYNDDTIYAAQMNPPKLPDKIPTGLYRRTFHLPEHFLGKRLLLRFCGVASGFYCWMNGNPVGYSQDGALDAEFDVSRVTYAGENNITVQVMRFTDATWLESSGGWSLSGLFRSVELLAKPRLYIQDSRIVADAHGHLTFDVKIKRVNGYADTTVRLSVYDPDGHPIYESVQPPNASPLYRRTDAPQGWARFVTHIAPVQTWSPETPVRYSARLSLLAANGEEMDRDTQYFGFRSIEIANGEIRLNDRRFVFRGLNYEAFDRETGHALDAAQMREQLTQMKAMNVNAVRSIGQPNGTHFYDLCDELGMVAVVDVHAGAQGVGARLTDDPEWAEAYLIRARRMVQTHKNHPCILMWSLGSTPGGGPNHAAMAAWIRAFDPSRPVMYAFDDACAALSDVRCLTHPTPDAVIDALTQAADPRPLLLGEFAVQCLNSGGGLEKWLELTMRFPRFQGGFAARYRDGGLTAHTPEGEPYIGYGGDFYEAVTEPFAPKCAVIAGMVDSNGVLKPAGRELQEVYAPVFVARTPDGRYFLHNQYHTRTLEGFRAHWRYLTYGAVTESGEMPLPPLPPMSARALDLPPYASPTADNLLDIEVVDPEGEARSHRQFPLSGAFAAPRRRKFLPTSYDDSHGQIAVHGATNLCVGISKLTGNITRVSLNGCNYVLQALSECAVRGLSGVNVQPEWGAWRDWSAFAQENVSRRVIRLTPCLLADGRVEIERVTRLESHSVPGASVDTYLQMRIAGDGEMTVTARFMLAGVASVERLGVVWTLPEGFEVVEWFGRGPGESYPDRTLSAPLGIYRSTVADMHVPYTPPSENGGREAARWVRFATNDGRALLIRSETPFHFDAHHYTVSDLRDAAHDHELIRRPETVVHIDAVHAGIGGNMAFPTLQDPNYRVQPGEYRLQFDIRLT